MRARDACMHPAKKSALLGKVHPTQHAPSFSHPSAGKPEIRVLQPIDPSKSGLTCRDYYSQVMRDAGDCLVNSGPAIMALSSASLGWVLLTLLYTMVLIFRVYAELARYRYQQHRTANIQVRLVAAARAWSQTIMVLCIVLYWFVHMHSCASYIMTAYGFAPWMVRKEEGGGGVIIIGVLVGPAGAQGSPNSLPLPRHRSFSPRTKRSTTPWPPGPCSAWVNTTPSTPGSKRAPGSRSVGWYEEESGG